MGKISDAIIKKLRRGFFIIDVHAHIGETIGVGVFLPEHIRVTPENLIKNMNYNGTDMAIVSPLVGYPSLKGIKDTQRQNDRVADAVSKYPDKFPCGLGIVNPYEVDESIEETHRIMKDFGLRGLLFHTVHQGTYLNHPLIIKILKELSNYPGAVTLAHTTSGMPAEPWRIGELAERFPKITFISAHPSLGVGQLGQHISFCKRFKNLYVDTALWIPEDETWLTAKALGSEHIVYGGDIGGISRVSFGLLELLLSDVFTDEDLERIFSRNAAKILNIKI